MLFLLLAHGCVRGEDSDTSKIEGDHYTVRGRIVSLPIEGKPFSALRLHHESIPTFRDIQGNVPQLDGGQTGMLSMVMEFPLGKNVSLGTLGAGDGVEFDLTVTWGSPPYFITRIEALPAGTTLDFDPPLEPSGSNEHSVGAEVVPQSD